MGDRFLPRARIPWYIWVVAVLLVVSAEFIIRRPELLHQLFRAGTEDVVAFPGAEGYGRFSRGGRGGVVLFVTNLNDAGEGSFRYAAESASGPRTIIFQTGGTITLTSPVVIRNPYVTIAGQTAPGGGITIRGEPVVIATHNVIVRGLRVRTGDEGGPTCCRGGIEISSETAPSDVYNVIIDHSSASWGISGSMASVSNPAGGIRTRDITIQWSIISEGLRNSDYLSDGSPAPNSKGLRAGSGDFRLSVHHNLFAHNDGHNALINGIKNAEFVNNVIYNWGAEPLRIESRETWVNIIGNYFKPGSNSIGYDIAFADSQNSNTHVYISGNYADSSASRTLDATMTRFPTNDQTAVILQQNTSMITSWYTSSPPFFYSANPVASSGLTIQTVLQAYQDVLTNSGASNRDAVDTRIINSVTQRTGSIIDSQNQVGGWPTISSGALAADADSDGMPDSYEATNGLNPNDASDRNSKNCAGFTMLEVYINSLIPVPIPAAIIPCSTPTSQITPTVPPATATPTLPPVATPTPTTPNQTPTPTKRKGAAAQTTETQLKLMSTASVSITEPTDGTVLPATGSQRISATATDPEGISSIQLYFDTVLLKTCDGTTECKTQYQITDVTPGSHTISAIATSVSQSSVKTEISVTK